MNSENHYWLADDDFSAACGVGLARYLHSRRKGLDAHDQTREYGNGRNRSPFERILSDQRGACGELVACRHLGAEWPAYIDRPYKEPDVIHNGIRYEIRTRFVRSYHPELYAYQYERSYTDAWILVLANMRCFRIIGYARADIIYRPEHRRGRADTFWIPQAKLTPLPLGGISRDAISDASQPGALSAARSGKAR